MRITPATPLSTRLQSPPLRGELISRYAAAYGCTLIAIAAAQLIIPNQLAALLAFVTLAGLPLSLYWRYSNLRLFGYRIPRFIINSTLVILSGFCCFYLLLLMQPDLLERGAYNTLVVTTRSAGESIAILMNMFLVFAAIRSLAIINDKDAVLSAVPSFSVLLLLIVVHRGPQVVAYFLLWAIVAAILFSLDHRAEARHNLSGVIASAIPGQDVKLSARGLASVMGFSLLCAVSISYYLSSRNPDERSVLEMWIMGMASRATQLALNLPDVSVNSGPERQIDYSSGPALPTRTELWTVAAATLDGETIRPMYWRMFSLSQYNGSSWSQSPGSGTAIPLQVLDSRRWPPRNRQGGFFQRNSPNGNALNNNSTNSNSSQNNSSRNNPSGATFQVPPQSERRAVNRSASPNAAGTRAPINGAPSAPPQRGRINSNTPLPARPLAPARGDRQGRERRFDQNPDASRTYSFRPVIPGTYLPNRRERSSITIPVPGTGNPGMNNGNNPDRMRFSFRRRGYDIAKYHPFASRLTQSFGAPRQRVLQILEARVSNVGFIPALPSANILRIRSEKPPSTVRVRQDGGIDAGVVLPGEPTLILSEVAPQAAYGMGIGRNEGPPGFKSKRPNPRAFLSAAERRANLKLPARLTAPGSRVRRYAHQILASAPQYESNFRRAKRLALAIQEGAVYTLRPPQIPEGVDAAEYFLFSSRRGYCTYFAGALTVLCRAAGIPARVVSGFVNPDWDAGGGQLGVLREANAHAWTEVWVDGWGWAIVDATPADDRGENAPSWWENWSDLFGATIDTLRLWSAAHLRQLSIAALLLLPLILWLAIRSGVLDPLLARLSTSLPGRVQLSKDQSRRLIEKSYLRAARKLARKFRRRIAWETPHEYLAAAEAALNLENPTPLRELTALYAQVQYSPAQITAADGKRAYEAVRELSFRRRRAPSDLATRAGA